MAWQELAVCAEEYKKRKPGDPDPFFPIIIDADGEEWYDDGTIWQAFGDTDSYYDEAREICNRCPVKEQCLQHALDNKERWGMWGGTTPIERRRVERRERRERRKLRLAAEDSGEEEEL